ncbi:MAG: hypothetical protein WC455_17240 [Dehalococcoidia bacterium]|jgi:hypothetical protein
MTASAAEQGNKRGLKEWVLREQGKARYISRALNLIKRDKRRACGQNGYG